MNHKTENGKDNTKAETPVDPTELDEQALEKVDGGLIGLLLPAVQKVRASETRQMGDGSVRPVSQEIK